MENKSISEDNAKKPESSTFVRASIISGVSLVLAIIANYFFFNKSLGIQFFIFTMLVSGVLVYFFFKIKSKISKDVYLVVVALVFFSFMVFVRSNSLLTFLNVVASILLVFLIITTSSARKIRTFFIRDWVSTIFLPFKFIVPIFDTLSDTFSFKGDNETKKTFSRVLMGIIIAIPILVLFTMLFSSADLVFQKHILNLFNFDGTFSDKAARVIRVVFVSLFFVGMYSYAFRKTATVATTDASVQKTYVFGSIEVTTIMSLVNILFLSFIFIQLAYLFGGTSTVASGDFTYAEYARRGFFELMFVAIISFVLLTTTEKYISKKETNHTTIFKILSGALILQVMVIIISSFKRLALYEETFGFTTMRLYSHSFTVLLAVLFIFLLYKIFFDTRETTFVFRCVVAVALFLAVMNILNPDAFIVKQNIKRFHETGKLDTYYLNSLSTDSIPILIQKIPEIEDITMRNNLEESLSYKEKYTDLFYVGDGYFWGNQTDDPWYSVSLSRVKAQKILDAYNLE